MTNLLRGVVLRGTAAKAASLNWPLGGKTGTTDDYTDAWFVGFDPDITIGVWVGLDQKKPIGSNMTGAEAALPIWMDIMKAWIGDRKEPPQFPSPGNIVFVTLPGGKRYAFIGDLTWQMDGITRGAERPWLLRRVADVDAGTVRLGLRRSIALSRVLQIVPAHDVAAFDSIPLLPSRFPGADR